MCAKVCVQLCAGMHEEVCVELSAKVCVQRCAELYGIVVLMCECVVHVPLYWGG